MRDGKLVLFHRLADLEVVQVLDAATGKPLWRHAYPTRYQDPYGYNNGPRCAPVITRDRVYTFGAEGKLTCLDFATGAEVWQRDTAKDFDIPEAFFGVGSTPLLEGGKLIVMIGGQPDAGMVAFDPANGKTLWQSVGEKNWSGRPKLDWPGEPPVDWRRSDKQASYASPVAATVNVTAWLPSCVPSVSESIAKVAEVCPAGIVTVAGPFASVRSLLVSVTTSGEVVAVFRDTVPTTPPTTPSRIRSRSSFSPRVGPSLSSTVIRPVRWSGLCSRNTATSRSQIIGSATTASKPASTTCAAGFR